MPRPLTTAIDAGWLRSVDPDADAEFARIQLMMAILDSEIVLLVDHAQLILSEYERVLEPGSYGRNFYKVCHGRGLVRYVDGSVSNACRAGLDAIGFDVDDRPYVGVCQTEERSVFLTHEVKLLAVDIAEKVRESCSVAIMGTDELKAIL